MSFTTGVSARKPKLWHVEPQTKTYTPTRAINSPRCEIKCTLYTKSRIPRLLNSNMHKLVDFSDGNTSEGSGWWRIVSTENRIVILKLECLRRHPLTRSILHFRLHLACGSTASLVQPPRNSRERNVEILLRVRSGNEKRLELRRREQNALLEHGAEKRAEAVRV